MMEQHNVSLYIMTDGNRTVAEARMIAAGMSGQGSAGREPGDKADAFVGEDLAVARALRSLAAHLERRARGRVNHAESIKAHKAEIAIREAAHQHALAETARVAGVGKLVNTLSENFKRNPWGTTTSIEPGFEF